MKSLVAFVCLGSVCSAFQSVGGTSKFLSTQPRAASAPWTTLKRQDYLMIEHKEDQRARDTSLEVSPIDMVPSGVEMSSVMQVLAGAAALLAAGAAANSGKKVKSTGNPVAKETKSPKVSQKKLEIKKERAKEAVSVSDKEAEKEKVFQEALFAAAAEMQAQTDAMADIPAATPRVLEASKENLIVAEQTAETTTLPLSTPVAIADAPEKREPEKPAQPTQLEGAQTMGSVALLQNGTSVIPSNDQSVQVATLAGTSNIERAQSTSPRDTNIPQAPKATANGGTPVQLSAPSTTQSKSVEKSTPVKPPLPRSAQQNALQSLKKTYSFENNNEKEQTNELRQLLQQKASQQTVERMNTARLSIPRRVVPREPELSQESVADSKIVPPKRDNTDKVESPSATPSKREQLKESISGVKDKLKSDKETSEKKSSSTLELKPRAKSKLNQGDSNKQLVKDKKEEGSSPSVRGFMKKRSVLIGAFVLVVGRRLIMTWMGRGMM